MGNSETRYIEWQDATYIYEIKEKWGITRQAVSEWKARWEAAHPERPLKTLLRKPKRPRKRVKIGRGSPPLSDETHETRYAQWQSATSVDQE